jgi:hypothetical protein
MHLLWYDGTTFRVFQSPTQQDFLTITMAQQDFLTIAAAQAGTYLTCESPIGTGSAYDCPLAPAPTGYIQGMRIYWRPAVNSAGGETTLAVNALGTRPLKLADGVTNPSSDELVAGLMYALWYDGAQFRVLDFLPARVALRSELRSSSRLRCASSATVAQDFTCQMTPTLTAYDSGLVVDWIPDVDADGEAVTLNVDGLGPIAVKRNDGAQAPRAGEFLAGTLQPLWYDGTDFRMVLSQQPLVGEGLRPACDVSVRGKWWFLPGEVGIADSLAVCAKDDLDAYAWREVYP